MHTKPSPALHKLCKCLALSSLCFLPALAIANENRIQLQDDGAGLTLKAGERPILRYNYMPFEGTGTSQQSSPPAYRLRTGYIHPVWSPSGSELTEIYPKTHAHHLGLWHAWTKTTYQGESFDFWNLKKVDEAEMIQFTDFISKEEGPESAGFKAKHVYTLHGETVLNETLEVKAHENEGHYFIDYIVTQEWLKEDPLILKQWRYGGAIAWRYPSRWIDGSATAETSEGGTQPMGQKSGADATQSRWLKVHGHDAEQEAGFLIMSHPENFRHPETLRVLHINAKAGGYVHFSPTKEAPWKLEKGQTQTYRYRICTYDNQLTTEQAEAYWKSYVEATAN